MGESWHVMHMVIVIILLASGGYFVSSKNSYAITGPGAYQPGLDFRSSVSILKASSGVNVTAFLLDGSTTLSSHSKILDQGQTGMLTLSVPSNPQGRLEVRYIGTGGLQFDKKQSYLSTIDSTYILLQTDRSMYTENEEVKLRVVVLNVDLTPYSGTVDISVKNSKQSTIENWQYQATHIGVVEKTFSVGSHPEFGEWTITARVGYYNEKKKAINVKRYVIPKFNVTVSGPQFYTDSTTSLTYDISAKYTFDRDVFGLLHCQAYVNENNVLLNQTKDISGIAKFVVSNFINPMRPINIVCEVGERGTGTTVSDGLEVIYKKEKATGTSSESWKMFPSKTTVRPGLNFKAFFQFPKSASGKRATIQISQIEKSIRKCYLRTPPFDYATNERTVRSNSYIIVEDDGFAEWSHKVDNNVTKLSVTAAVDSVQITTDLKAVLSPYQKYINMMPRKPIAKIGTPYIVDVEFNFAATGPAIYQVIGRGLQVKSGQVNMTGSRSAELNIQTTKLLVPEFRILIYYTTSEGEIIADEMLVKADGDPMMNTVQLLYSKQTVKPGDIVDISISTAPNSTVFLLSIDQGAEIISEGHDIYATDITNQLFADVSSFHTLTSQETKKWVYWKYYSSANDRYAIDSSDILHDAGISMLSDFDLFKYDPEETIKCEPEKTTTLWHPIINEHLNEIISGFLPDPVKSNVNVPVLKSDSVRHVFKTTWIWNKLAIGPTGNRTISTNVPDSITTWMTSAFAVNEKLGIGILTHPEKVTVFKDAFMEVRFPDFAYVGETIVMTVTIFNYQNQFKRFLVRGNYTKAPILDEIVQIVEVKNNSQKGILVPIKVKSPGRNTVSLLLQNYPDVWTKVDSVKRDFIVKASGTEQTRNVPTLCSLGRLKSTCKKTIPVRFPQNAVPESKQIMVTVSGNVMVQTIDGLRKLIRQPKGCGEQTMVNLVPNIFVMKYLTATCNLTSDVRSKLLNYMNEGVTHELTWRRNDGSFSAWGNSDSAGNRWLTAYVTLSFVEAAQFIQVDSYVIRGAVQFLLNSQNSDGSFTEQNLRYDVFMQGGTISNHVTMTSFVLLALNAAKKIPNLNVDIKMAVEKGKRYLERNIDNQEDPYALAISSYTLKMLQSSLSVRALQKLRTKRKTDHDSVYFTSDFNVRKRATTWHPDVIQKTDRTIDIETTAYALLAHVIHKDADNAAPIMRWLIFQRNPNGGFLSSQDTVVGLRALSEYSMMTANCNNYGQRTQIQVTTNLGHSLHITDDNKNVVQHFDIPVNTPSLTIKAQGEGTALIDVVSYYNVKAISPARFNVYRSNIISETFSKIKAEVCISRNDNEKNGMVVVEIALPTGFKADMDALSTTGASIRHSENDVDKINLYFDEIPSNGNCITFASVRVDKATHAGKLPVLVYDYYHPSNQGLGYYESGNLTNLDLCTVCKECAACHQIIG